jgi:flagellar FliL protein
MAKQPEADAEAPAAAAPKSRKKLIIIVAAAVLVLGGGAAAWMMMGKHKEGEPAAAEKKVAKAEGPPLFLPLESFVVNLQPPTSNQFLQVDITLRLADAHAVDEVKTLMPEVRDRILRLLATRTAPELVATGGREKLAEAVRLEVTRVVDPAAVKAPPKPAIEKQAEGEPPEPSAETEPPAGEPAAEAVAEAAEPAAAEEQKVRAVLFTSFIIQ